MTKENTSNNLYSSTSLSTPSAPLRWMHRFMYKSSSPTFRQSTPTFSVASITKVHTFGKLKQQHSNSNMDKTGGLTSSSGGNCNYGSRTKLHQTRQRHHYDETNNNNTHHDISGVESILTKLPVELIQDILIRLDCITLYQLCLSSSSFRRLLQKSTMVWRTLMIDPSLTPKHHQQGQGSLELYKMVCFMVTSGLHVHVDSLILDGCSFLDPALLDTLIRAYPNMTRLSLVNCLQIGCWQILYMLRASIKGNYQLAMLERQQQHHHQVTQEEGQQRQPHIDQDDESTLLLAALKTIGQPQQQKTTLFTKSGFSNATHASPSLSPSSTETSTTRPLSTRGHILDLTRHHQHHLDTQTTDSSNKARHALLPCLTHLTRLDMEGAFPSERSYKSHTHEMYCFGEIKKALLQLGQDNNNENMAPTYQQLSEAHYALYQFWLLLRSHMLRWDASDDEQETQGQQPSHPRGTAIPTDESSPHRWQDFRPPWLPDTLVQFIQITEQDQPSSSVKIDLAPCSLCHRNVAPPPQQLQQQQQPLCYACHSPTQMVCAQCRCHSCHAVLCPRCHHTHQARFRQSTTPPPHQQQPSASNTTATPMTAMSTATTTTTTIDTALSLSSWRTLHCQQCHLPRRICGQLSCVNQLENNKQHRWTCTSCQQQQKWARQRKVPPRFFKKARHWSHWI